MTLIGKTSAVVSLGLSCQTAWQLHLNREFLSELISEELTFKKSLFNYTLSQPAEICKYLSQGPGQIISASDITVNEENYLYVERLKLWLVHDSKVLTPDNFPVVASKYSYLSDNFWNIRNCQRRLFIVSNTQNNLYRQDIPGVRKFALDEKDMRSIRRSIAAAFPTGENIVEFVCYSDRVTAPSSNFHTIETDDSWWEGDKEKWAALYPHLLRSWIDPATKETLTA